MDYSLGIFTNESNVKEEVKRPLLNNSLKLPNIDEKKPLLL